MSMLTFVRVANAKKTFKIKDGFKFIEFVDVSGDGPTTDDPIPDQLEVWASIKVNYAGSPPESYKALNLIIGDWVEANEKELTDAIHKKLREHFQEKYPNSDVSELDGEDSSIWLDQLDYMPVIDDDQKTMIIEIELIMDAEVC